MLSINVKLLTLQDRYAKFYNLSGPSYSTNRMNIRFWVLSMWSEFMAMSSYTRWHREIPLIWSRLCTTRSSISVAWRIFLVSLLAPKPIFREGSSFPIADITFYSAVPITILAVDRSSPQRVSNWHRWITLFGSKRAPRTMLTLVSLLLCHYRVAQDLFGTAKVFELCLAEIEKRTSNSQPEPTGRRCLIM